MPSPIVDLWRTATSPQPAPSTWVVLGTAAAVLLLLAVPTAWHALRHLVTIVHEAGHATVAVLAGRKLSGIRVHSDTSGLTTSRGAPRGPGMVLTLAAGYPAPAVLGVGVAALVSRGYAVGALWLLLVLLALVLVQIRNLYGLWAVLATAAVLVGITGWAPVTWCCTRRRPIRRTTWAPGWPVRHPSRARTQRGGWPPMTRGACGSCG